MIYIFLCLYVCSLWLWCVDQSICNAILVYDSVMASTVNNGSSLTSVTLPGFDHNDTTLGNYYNSHLSTLPASQYYSVSSTGGNTWQTSVYSYQHTNNSVASATLIDFPTTHHQRLWPETALNRTTLLDSVSDSTAAASTHISASTLTSPYTTGGGVNSTSPFSLPYSPYFSSSPSNNLPHDDGEYFIQKWVAQTSALGKTLFNYAELQKFS